MSTTVQSNIDSGVHSALSIGQTITHFNYYTTLALGHLDSRRIGRATLRFTTRFVEQNHYLKLILITI